MVKRLSKSARLWLHGLGAALVSGGAGGMSASLGANLIAPETFNIQDGIGKMLALAGMVAAVSAVNGVAAYLKQSPLPPPEE